MTSYNRKLQRTSLVKSTNQEYTASFNSSPFLDSCPILLKCRICDSLKDIPERSNVVEEISLGTEWVKATRENIPQMDERVGRLGTIHLTFPKGAVLERFARIEISDWSYGRYENSEGWFPSSSVVTCSYPEEESSEDSDMDDFLGTDISLGVSDEAIDDVKRDSKVSEEDILNYFEDEFVEGRDNKDGVEGTSPTKNLKIQTKIDGTPDYDRDLSFFSRELSLENSDVESSASDLINDDANDTEDGNDDAIFPQLERVPKDADIYGVVSKIMRDDGFSMIKMEFIRGIAPSMEQEEDSAEDETDFLGLRTNDISASQLSESRENEDVMEKYLFYGADFDTIADVMLKGFGPNSRENSVLGSAVYFYESIRFVYGSDRSVHGEEEERNTHAILLCKMMVKREKAIQVHEPFSEHFQLDEEVDVIVGESVSENPSSLFQESIFAVKDYSCVIPEFLVTYEKR